MTTASLASGAGATSRAGATSVLYPLRENLYLLLQRLDLSLALLQLALTLLQLAMALLHLTLTLLQLLLYLHQQLGHIIGGVYGYDPKKGCATLPRATARHPRLPRVRTLLPLPIANSGSKDDALNCGSPVVPITAFLAKLNRRRSQWRGS